MRLVYYESRDGRRQALRTRGHVTTAYEIYDRGVTRLGVGARTMIVKT